MLIRRPHRIGRGALFALLLACLMPAPAARAAGEDELKAAFSVNIARFTAWPDHPGGELRLCVLGDDAVKRAAGAFEGLALGHRTLHVTRIDHEADLKSCHMLYLGAAESARVGYVLGLLRPGATPRPVLTISDMPDFIERGGMVQLFRQGEQIRFMVNPSAVIASGLCMSSKLLQLAIIKEHE